MKFLKLIKNYWVLLVVILFTTFWIAYFATEYLYNNNHTTYTVDITGEFEEIDENFFLEALAKYENNVLIGYSYASVDVKKMFLEENIRITYTENGVQVTVLAKYFINSQGVLVSNESLSRFEK